MTVTNPYPLHPDDFPHVDDGRQPENRLLVDSREASSLLSISPRTLWALQAAGEIPVIRIGRSVRYAVNDLMIWIEWKKNGGTDR